MENPKPEIENYRIDPRLRPDHKGKKRRGRPREQYPPELERLFDAFRTREMGPIRTDHRRPRTSYQRQISLIERSFRDFFLHDLEGYVTLSPAIQRDPTTGKILTPPPPKNPEERIKTLDPIHRNVIRRVNARLKYFNPRLMATPDQAYRLYLFHLDKKDPYGEGQLWAWLAMAISELDPALVKECKYCGKIFISRKWRDFHPGCGRRFFYEKDIKAGKPKQRQKAYRERLKKKVKRRKTA